MGRRSSAGGHVDRSITLDSWVLWHRGGINVIYHLLLGFASASYMASQLGFGLLMAATWSAIVQIHGQTQRAGWLGQFIMGVSLYVLPPEAVCHWSYRV